MYQHETPAVLKSLVLPQEIVKPRVLIFIGSLRTGGKERRLIEMLTYFKTKNTFEFLVVITTDEINYRSFFQLDIPCKVLKKSWKRNDLTLFFKFYKICKLFKPHIIHTWGRIQCFYTLPTVISQKIPLINSQITSAPTLVKRWSVNRMIDLLNFHFSKFILSNSQAGIRVFSPPSYKSRIIYNGINMKRFENLPDQDYIREKYEINTPLVVVMAASFSPQKDYDLFFKVAKIVTTLRHDVTFIGVGGYHNSFAAYRRLVKLSAEFPRIIFRGRTDEVEALMNVSTMGLLFSPNGEGISNSLLEFMSLAKPVIANDAGGTSEVIRDNTNGYLITTQNVEEIAKIIMDLLDDPEKCKALGESGRNIVNELFSLDKMGGGFENVYREVLNQTNLVSLEN